MIKENRLNPRRTTSKKVNTFLILIEFHNNNYKRKGKMSFYALMENQQSVGDLPDPNANSHQIF